MATKSKVTSTSNLNADESGSPVPVPVPAQNGQTVDDMPVRPRRKLSLAAKLAKIGKTGDTILKLRSEGAKLEIRIGSLLNELEPLWIGEDGKPGTLPIVVTDIDGSDITADLTFNEYAQRKLRLNYSSTRQYMQAGRFATDHPAAVQAGKVPSKEVGVMLESASVRKPEALAAILSELPVGVSIDTAAAVIERHAPKPVKTPKVQDTSKIQTALEASARDDFWKLLDVTVVGMEAAQIVAVQDALAEVAAMTTDPSIGKSSAVFTLALSQLSGEWNRKREAAEAKKAEQAERRAKRTR